MYCHTAVQKRKQTYSIAALCGADSKGPNVPKVKEIVNTLKVESQKNRHNWLNSERRKRPQNDASNTSRKVWCRCFRERLDTFPVLLVDSAGSETSADVIDQDSI
jgi:hypothetical protein